MYFWEIGMLNQLFFRDSYNQIKFSKKLSSWWQAPIICDGSMSYFPFNLS